jgi:diadenosine tetraphosphate (Ap4A) HIT family hydrolase
VDDAWKHDRIGSALRGENPMVISRMPSGFAVIGDAQFLPGYCVLLAHPQVPRLEDMEHEARTRFLADMGLFGEAISRACRPHRMNYAIYGNGDPFVHAHLIPRYASEPPERLRQPVWSYPEANWSDPALAYDETRHGELKARIAAELRGLMRGG